MRKKGKLILEFSEFNANRFNSDNTDVSIGLASDNSLSVNAFDRHQDNIRAGMSKVNNIMQALSNSAAFQNLKSQLNYDKQKPETLKIIRIIPNNNVDYYVYLTFKINDIEYDGLIKDILTNPVFSSNVFQDKNLTQTEEWQIKFKGLILNTIKNWLSIKPGKYLVLNQSITAFNSQTGGISKINKNAKIEVVKTVLADKKIIIKYDNDFYNLVKNDFIYFNYWFEKI